MRPYIETPYTNFLSERGLKGDAVSKDNFPLPTLGKDLEGLRDQVYQGRGLAIVRGLDPQKYADPADLIVIYLGVSSYIAERRGKQDQRGSMLGKLPRNLLKADARVLTSSSSCN